MRGLYALGRGSYLVVDRPDGEIWQGVGHMLRLPIQLCMTEASTGSNTKYNYDRIQGAVKHTEDRSGGTREGERERERARRREGEEGKEGKS